MSKDSYVTGLKLYAATASQILYIKEPPNVTPLANLPNRHRVSGVHCEGGFSRIGGYVCSVTYISVRLERRLAWLALHEQKVFTHLASLSAIHGTTTLQLLCYSQICGAQWTIFLIKNKNKKHFSYCLSWFSLYSIYSFCDYMLCCWI